MRVLIFQAATSAVAIAAMTRLSDEVRAAGHNGGLRNLDHFRREKEPADRILVALKPSEAARLKDRGAELLLTFQDIDKITPIELPEDDEELADFDFADAVDDLDDEETGFMSMDQLRAECIERGLEIRADSTREELEHSLDIDIHPGAQAGDRVTDRENATGMREDRIGVRTSTVLPTANGLDLDRMNDEQLGGVAAALGIPAERGEKRETIVNRIMKGYAKKVRAPEDSPPRSRAQQPSSDVTVNNSDLDIDNADELKAIAEKEKVELGDAESVEDIRAKITAAREATAAEEAEKAKKAQASEKLKTSKRSRASRKGRRNG